MLQAFRIRSLEHVCGIRAASEKSMITKICWAILLAIHTMPALALFRPTLISKMYRVNADSPLFLLFQHRAALFLVICVICLWSIFRPETRPLATVAVGISMISFVLIWLLAGAPSALKSIAVVDIIGLPFLIFAGWQAFKIGG
jgi:hypothetical protein